MTKYKIFKINSTEGEWFYCKEKFGPFWVTPFDSNLSYPFRPDGSKNSKCRRFKTKERLLEVIYMIRQQELESEIHCAKLNKILHIEQEIV